MRLPDPASHRWQERHFNRPQLLAMMVRANTMVCRIARGVGKTQGILGPWLQHNALHMSRSLGGILVPTYKKFFSELVPSLYEGFDTLNLVEEKHYFIGKRGPTKWERPHKKVKDWSNSIHWCNGSGQALISQDKPGLGNGLSLDYLAVEEAKLVKSRHYYSSVRPAIRGNRQHFGHMAEHQSTLIISDAGRTSTERWFETYRDQVDPEISKVIIQACLKQQQLFLAIRAGGLSVGTVRKYTQLINKIEQDLVPLRKACVYYLEADIFDNIEVHGLNKLLLEEKTMPPDEFARSYLNITPDTMEGAWYHAFDPSRHCYEPQATDWLMARGFDREHLTAAREDARKDAEILPSLELDIAMDYGGNFNCIVIGQRFGSSYRVDKEFFEIHPGTTQDCVTQFCHYYRHHKHKVVNYFWDHTAVDKHGTSQYNYQEQVVNTLREDGWTVESHYIGHTPSPKLRYEFVNKLFRAGGEPVQLNPQNCENLITSIRLTRIREGGREGLRKDKRGEDGFPADQLHQPHLGDALDTLLWGRFQHLEGSAISGITSIFT